MLNRGAPIPTDHANYAFTIIEVVVTVALVGLLASISAVTFSQRHDDDRIRSSTKLLASWIDDKRKNTIQAGSPCKLTFKQDTSEVIFGDNPECTASMQSFDLTKEVSDGSNLQLTMQNSTTEIFFSPRGTTNDPAQADVSLTIGLSGSSARLGCIKIIEPLGLIRIARHNGDQKCDYTSPF